MNQLYNLEQTFKAVQEDLRKNHFFKIYKEFEPEIELFKEVLKNFQKDLQLYERYVKNPAVIKELGIKGVYFWIDITTGIENDSYHLIWDIDKIKEYITKQRLKVHNISLNTEQIHSKGDYLEDKKLKNLQNIDYFNEPIILASIPFINKYIVIDGNHRFHIAKAQKHHSIKAILLPLSVHIDFICFDSSKICLKVHHNISLLLSLCLSPKKPLTSINKNLGIHDYYPITGNELNFSSLKNNLLSLRQKLSVIPLFS